MKKQGNPFEMLFGYTNHFFLSIPQNGCHHGNGVEAALLAEEADTPSLHAAFMGISES